MEQNNNFNFFINLLDKTGIIGVMYSEKGKAIS